MPTKRLERLMFVQGGACFFCKSALPKAEASIEHLFASANGGGNNEDNCVACCKSLNAILGSMSLKDKFQIVLNQRGNFKCPNIANIANAAAVVVEKFTPPLVATAKAPAIAKPDNFALAVANLTQRGSSRPKTLKALTSTVTAIFGKGLKQTELAALIQRLQTTGKVTVDDGKVSYAL
jgi:hypothetical protein